MGPIKFSTFMIAVVVLAVNGTAALENGLAALPPMGWLAWTRFTCEVNCEEFPDECINEKLFLDMADRLASDGYKDLGYQFVNIDDCWSEMERSRDNQTLVANLQRFPRGIHHLANDIHSKGLKLGIYGDCGTKTCAGYPAQLKSEQDLGDNYFDIDANTFASWQVDSFKFDNCFINASRSEAICPRMSAALRKTDRPMLIMCEWPFYMLTHNAGFPNFTLAQQSCNSWRYYEDVEDSWQSVMGILDFTITLQPTIYRFHGPNSWFDPDQLVIGNFGLSLDQAKAQMALWCIWGAPLYMSNDLRRIEPEMAQVLKNKELINVDQDPLGVFGLMIEETDESNIQAFVKPIEKIKNGCPSFAVVYLNRYTLGNRRKVSFKVRDLLVKSGIGQAAIRYAALYTGSPGGEFSASSCRNKLTNAMTSDPSKIPETLIVNRPNESEIEYQSIFYDVFDMFENRKIGQVALNSTLDLYVNPTGVRAIRLEVSGAYPQASSSRTL